MTILSKPENIATEHVDSILSHVDSLTHADSKGESGYNIQIKFLIMMCVSKYQ